MGNLGVSCIGRTISSEKFIEQYYSIKKYYNTKAMLKQNAALSDTFYCLKQADGFLSSILNKFLSQEKRCNSAIKKHKEGTMSYKNAKRQVKLYETLQKLSSGIIASKAAGIIASGTAVVTANEASATGVLAISALSGAVTKAIIKSIDRTTNNIKGDVINPQKVSKDVKSGGFIGLSAGGLVDLIKSL